MKKTLIMLLCIFMIVGVAGCSYEDEKEKKGPTAYMNTTWKTTDGYALEIGTNSCKVTFNGKVLKNKCEFTINSNGSRVGKITVCNEYGLNCDDFTISKENYLYDQIYVFRYIWYRQ